MARYILMESYWNKYSLLLDGMNSLPNVRTFAKHYTKLGKSLQVARPIFATTTARRELLSNANGSACLCSSRNNLQYTSMTSEYVQKARLFTVNKIELELIAKEARTCNSIELLFPRKNRLMCSLGSRERTCWNCKKKIGLKIFFCDICRIIQPPLCEMSYFEMFESTETFDIDVKRLSAQYRERQALLHPDKFGNSKEEERQYSLEQSALINKAYNTLLDPLSRAVYLLHLHNINITEENTVEGTEFLMEIMEINEALSEVKSTKDLDKIRKENNDSIDNCIEDLSSSFEKGDFESAKELTIKLRYYRNILEMIKDKTFELE